MAGGDLPGGLGHPRPHLSALRAEDIRPWHTCILNPHWEALSRGSSPPEPCDLRSIALVVVTSVTPSSSRGKCFLLIPHVWGVAQTLALIIASANVCQTELLM